MAEIRPYREADHEAVIALWQACGLTRPWNPPAADIAFLRASGHGELLVAADMEQLIGTVMVGHDGHRGWIYYMAVDPARQRQGLGTRLLRAAEAVGSHPWGAQAGADDPQEQCCGGKILCRLRVRDGAGRGDEPLARSPNPAR